MKTLIVVAAILMLLTAGCELPRVGVSLGDMDAGAVAQVDCPVTQPPDPPLAPPRAFIDFWLAGVQPPEMRDTVTFPGPGRFYLGNEAAWLELPLDGTLTNTKQPWWRSASGRLDVVGRRIDGGVPKDFVSVAHIPDGYGDSGFQSGGWTFPAAGCWEVVASVGGGALRFVVRAQ